MRCRSHHFHSAKAVFMGNRERLTLSATSNEVGQLPLVGAPEPLDEFRHWPAVIPHRILLELDALGATVGLRDAFVFILFGAPHMDLAFFTVNPNFPSISGDVIAAHTDLCD